GAGLQAGALLVGRPGRERSPSVPRALPLRSRAGRRPSARHVGASPAQRARQPRDRAGRADARLARGDGGTALPDRRRTAGLGWHVPAHRLFRRLLDLGGPLARRPRVRHLRDRTRGAGTRRVSPALLSDDSVLVVSELTAVPEGEEFIVGDAATGVYVVLPAVGVQALELLASGR